MKKNYEAPELTLIKFSLMDVLETSPGEGGIGEYIDPGDPDDPISLDGL